MDKKKIATVALTLLLVLAGMSPNASAVTSGADTGAQSNSDALTAADYTLTPIPADEIGILAWECQGGYSCYYDGGGGNNRLWVAPGCGWHNLGEMNPPLNDRISSVRNLGSGAVKLYNYTGGGNWDHLITIPTATSADLFNQVNNTTDAVDIAC
jgi:hypothetical protein